MADKNQNQNQSRPRSPQEFYGDELARRRNKAGYTQAKLGEMCVISPQMIAHFEAGRRRPRPDDAKRLDQILETDGFFHRWRESLDEGRYPDHFAAAAEMESLAQVMRLYGSALIPGILQTPAYARAVFKAANVNYIVDDIERSVKTRIERAKLLKGEAEVWALLDESALRRPVGGPAVMAQQLRHIAALGRSGRVRVHVLPFSVGAHSMMESMLMLFRFEDAPPIAYVEGLKTGRIIDNPATVDDCEASYALALGDALPLDASLALLEHVAKEFEGDQ
ncbi:helix-turn-helix domain-containing protein [Streptomyces clavuligerus]|uniref:DNA-binding protein n=1 Tax=Streptomyces clavuligerus TaxID=1901 RepID=B5H0K4_STRCL|nr:helix-turn-helix transcriptional regulator [Streptomyces clavuligerus]ANW18891.1 transcriptional regulator [Streptomyces clavuligerus]AXU13467.1 XRE family transcriptional regulator [Streptomyces clavuligerus]EDY52100.1 DNA-binding protein [Streptomyces clavuligerus]EFG08406.1 DNA-binding protein [Streptomyces clavuligerus]MBY6303425.1 helix-turn-helix transcriptional regulator [Streptomyces clavuligerus]